MKNNLKLTVILTMLSFGISHAQTQVRSLLHDSIARSFRVHLPPAFDTCSHLPLIFNLHGYGSNAAQEEFYTQFSNVADTGRFIAVYPDGINNTWNVNGSGVDDVGFITAIIDTLYEELRIDRNRVYSCGMSMGGFMSYRLACELSDRLVAIASVTGLLATIPCNPSRPIPVMQIHGTDDPTVPYSGVDQTMLTWIQKNNCPTQPTVTMLPDTDPNDSATVTLSYYAPCADSTEVILYTINGGEHTWPDAFIDIGITTRDINASNIIWNFFRKYQFNVYPDGASCDSLTNLQHAVKNRPAFYVGYAPAIQQVTIETSSNENFGITLFDALGRSLKTFSFSGEKYITLPFTISSTGVYCYVISNVDGVVQKGKIAVY